jgi:hypothetical protein
MSDLKKPEIVSVEKIWDRAPHNAFTDLIRYQDQWWCTFREAAEHGEKSFGTLRVLVSPDGGQWAAAAVLAETGTDLRDPKLSQMPDGRLMIVAGGSISSGPDTHTDSRNRSPRVAFSLDGHNWTAPLKVLAEDHWLWRVTWHKGIGYSVSKLGIGSDPRRGMLYRTTDGLEWEWLTEFILPDNIWDASETTVRLMPDDEMVALIRPRWIGRSKPPYVDWSFTQQKVGTQGPNFIRVPDGTLWASTRGKMDDESCTVLGPIIDDIYEPILRLPSGGDTSYPGMVWHDGLLWMSYYSSHEEKSSIYLAKIRLP